MTTKAQEYKDLRKQIADLMHKAAEIKNSAEDEVARYVRFNLKGDAYLTTREIIDLSGGLLTSKNVRHRACEMGFNPFPTKRLVTNTYALIKEDGTVDLNSTIRQSHYTNCYTKR